MGVKEQRSPANATEKRHRGDSTSGRRIDTHSILPGRENAFHRAERNSRNAKRLITPWVATLDDRTFPPSVTDHHRGHTGVTHPGVQNFDIEGARLFARLRVAFASFVDAALGRARLRPRRRRTVVVVVSGAWHRDWKHLGEDPRIPLPCFSLFFVLAM